MDFNSSPPQNDKFAQNLFPVLLSSDHVKLQNQENKEGIGPRIKRMERQIVNGKGCNLELIMILNSTTNGEKHQLALPVR